MAHDDDVLDIIDDHDEPAAAPLHAPWVIAIIDDDPAVHQGTRFALADYVLHDQGSRSCRPIPRRRDGAS
jgi:hypothetical protein